MEQQIQDLINSIKKDGIDSATQESRKIIEEATRKAEAIVKEAEEEKNRILSSSMRQIEKERESFNSSLKMAARDLALTFKKEVEDKVQALLDDKVKHSLDEKTLKELVKLVIEAEFQNKDALVVLPEEMRKNISKELAGELVSELGQGVELTFSSSFQGGFKVAAKDGRAYIDLTDDEIVKLLYPYLSSSVRELI